MVLLMLNPANHLAKIEQAIPSFLWDNPHCTELGLRSLKLLPKLWLYQTFCSSSAKINSLCTGWRSFLFFSAWAWCCEHHLGLWAFPGSQLSSVVLLWLSLPFSNRFGLTGVLLTQFCVFHAFSLHRHILLVCLHEPGQFQRNPVSFSNSGVVCNCLYKAIF